jgi:hypothetical protein
LLSSWGIEFEGVDVEAEPARLADLKRLDVPRVPATIVDDRVVHGWNPKALAELVGIRYVETKTLSPEELVSRLDRVLAAAQRAMRQVPAPHLDMKAPGRDRTVRELGFHLFRVGASFPDAREQGGLRDAWFSESPPPELKDGAAIAAYGQTVRERVREFATRPGWCEGIVATYYGPQPAPAMMERTTWHAAQHLRQLYWFLERMGIGADTPLTAADFEGLPLPAGIWS